MHAPQAPVSQSPILLTTLNSSYAHSSFGLRYLLANMGPLRERTILREFTIAAQPRTVVEQLLSYKPALVGFGVYIWNTNETLKVISILKKVAPEIIIVLGGPEVSFETSTQSLYEKADYVIQGEADFLFRDLCTQLLIRNEIPQTQIGKDGTRKIVRGPLPEVRDLVLPYDLYSDSDIAHRRIYVELSRGCPYKCEYCLSSLDKSVRNFDIDLFLNEMQKLIDRGVRQFKFVDRTFNLSVPISTRILEFFLSNKEKNLFLHFELIPDRLPDELKFLIRQFPAGSLQFEIGIQTFSQHVQKNVSRRNDFKKVEENFIFLSNETGVHTHADLIVGLPGETMESFAEGFNRLVNYKPDEIQIGILKRLKGTPLTKKEIEFKLNYSEHAPFEILSTSTMSFIDIQNMQKFAKFWDLIANSGEFPRSVALLKSFGPKYFKDSFFDCFFQFSQYAGEKTESLHGISLERVAQILFEFMLTFNNEAPTDVATAIIFDYCFSGKRRDLPSFLKHQNLIYLQLKKDSSSKLLVSASQKEQIETSKFFSNHLPDRQRRHTQSREAEEK
jgi:radical SAM superfamily enzyme YgiQ (UPF0313 family)